MLRCSWNETSKILCFLFSVWVKVDLSALSCISIWGNLELSNFHCQESLLFTGTFYASGSCVYYYMFTVYAKTFEVHNSRDILKQHSCCWIMVFHLELRALHFCVWMTSCFVLKVWILCLSSVLSKKRLVFAKIKCLLFLPASLLPKPPTPTHSISPHLSSLSALCSRISQF